MTSDTEMDELRRLSEAATPGPWAAGGKCITARSSNPSIPGDDVVVSTAYSDRLHRDDEANLRFIVAAVNHVRDALSAPPATQDGWREITEADKIGRLRTRLLIAKYPGHCGWTDAYTGWWSASEGRWARWPHSFPPTHCMDVSVPADPPSA